MKIYIIRKNGSEPSLHSNLLRKSSPVSAHLLYEPSLHSNLLRKSSLYGFRRIGMKKSDPLEVNFRDHFFSYLLGSMLKQGMRYFLYQPVSYPLSPAVPDGT